MTQTRFGPYRLDRLLTSGGMAVIYLATEELSTALDDRARRDLRLAVDEDSRQAVDRVEEPVLAGRLELLHRIGLRDVGIDFRQKIMRDDIKGHTRGMTERFEAYDAIQSGIL